VGVVVGVGSAHVSDPDHRLGTQLTLALVRHGDDMQLPAASAAPARCIITCIALWHREVMNIIVGIVVT
jgi:hypothetical protein